MITDELKIPKFCRMCGLKLIEIISRDRQEPFDKFTGRERFRKRIVCPKTESYWLGRYYYDEGHDTYAIQHNGD